MRGIISAAGYLPYWRLERSAIGAFHGGRGSGTRTVASYDEDTTTLAVEAGRLALKGTTVEPETLWFATSTPTYAEKTNATVIHAALRLPAATAAFDSGSAVRSGVGALRAALRSSEPAVLVVAADIRGPREQVQDGKTGFLVPPMTDTPLAAALSRLASDPGLRAQMGAAGQAMALEKFDEGKVLARTVALLGA